MPYHDLRKGFGLAIKNWRAKSGISQEELAWRAGLHRSYVADIERGSRNASLQSIEKLAKALQVSLSTLFAPLSGSEVGSASMGLQAESLRAVEIILFTSEERQADAISTVLRGGGLRNRLRALVASEAADFLRARQELKASQLLLLHLSAGSNEPLQMLRALRHEATTRQMPVVVLTDQSTLAQQALRFGADASLAMPLSFESFAQVTAELGFGWTLEAPALSTHRSSAPES